MTSPEPRHAGQARGRTGRPRRRQRHPGRRSWTPRGKRFAAHGYDGATIRGIAADAGVDPALVHHFFGTKERLFAAAMRLPVVPGELIGTRAGRRGRAIPGAAWASTSCQVALSAWEVAEIRDTFLGLLRSAATSEQALIMLREFVTEAIVGRLAAAAQTADPAQARYRAALVASQVVGLGRGPAGARAGAAGRGGPRRAGRGHRARPLDRLPDREPRRARLSRR